MTQMLTFALRVLRLLWRVLWTGCATVIHHFWGAWKGRSSIEAAPGTSHSLGHPTRREPLIIATYRVTDMSGVDLGVLKLWFCQVSRICWREFAVGNRRLQGYLGSARVPLVPVRLKGGDSLPLVREPSLREVEALLKQKLEAGQLQTPGTKPQQGVPEKLNPVVAKPPNAAVVTAAVLPPMVEMPSGTPPDPDRPSRGAPVAARTRARVLQVDEGFFVGSGTDRRTVPDDDSPGNMKEVPSWYLDLELSNGENPGQVKRIWGADMERWVNQVQPRKGEHLKVEHLGRCRMGGAEQEGRRPRTMNLYRVERSARR